PTGSVDPNFGRRVRNRRQLNSLQNTWPYGYSMPIAVRYTQDAFSRSGWLWPVDAKGEIGRASCRERVEMTAAVAGSDNNASGHNHRSRRRGGAPPSATSAST